MTRNQLYLIAGLLSLCRHWLTLRMYKTSPEMWHTNGCLILVISRFVCVLYCLCVPSILKDAVRWPIWRHDRASCSYSFERHVCRMLFLISCRRISFMILSYLLIFSQVLLFITHYAYFMISHIGLLQTFDSVSACSLWKTFQDTAPPRQIVDANSLVQKLGAREILVNCCFSIWSRSYCIWMNVDIFLINIHGL